MAHFAKLDQDNVVVEVVVIHNNELLDESGQESEAKGIAFCKNLLSKHATWVQTSYNGKFRKNYAAIGYTYDAQRDAFIPPQKYASWTLNETTCLWEPPIPYPQDGGIYVWDENIQQWASVLATTS